MCFAKDEIDGAYKDHAHQVFFSDLRVELFFSSDDEVDPAAHIDYWEHKNRPAAARASASQQQRRYAHFTPMDSIYFV